MPYLAVLSDVIVVEIGHGIAGSVAGKVLAESGAQLTKAPLAALEGEPAHVVQAFADWDRGKRVLAADPGADGELAALVSSADVVIDQRWCRGRTRVETVLDGAPIRPDAIVCRVDTGLSMPVAALSIGDLESLVGAASGVFASAISGQSLSGVAFVDVPVASVAAGLHVATACAVALAHRPDGRLIEMALTDVAAFQKGVEFSRSDHLTTVQATQMGASGMYRCGDGEWVQLDAPSTRMTTRLWHALGGAGIDVSGLGGLLLDLVEVTPAQASRLRAELSATFAARRALEWEQLLAEADVPCGRCRTPKEWIESDLAVACGAVRVIEEHGRTRRVVGEVWR